MIRSADSLKSFTIGATDGEVGDVKDVYFDDERWVIRYLVVDTGEWLPGRKVLISPHAVRLMEWGPGRLDVALTRQQVKNSPDIDTDKPVSRQHEADYYAYYGYPAYWNGGNLWGAAAQPYLLAPLPPDTQEPQQRQIAHMDSHLRSAHDVSGYHIHASDGVVGHIEDFLFDEDTWQVRYIVVETRNWWPGKHVLIAPQWIETTDWANHNARVHATRAMVKESPPYEPGVPLLANYEADLHRHYGRPFRS